MCVSRELNYQIFIKYFSIFVVIAAMVKTVKKLTELIIEAFPLLQRFVLQLQLFWPKLSVQPITASVDEQPKCVSVSTEKIKIVYFLSINYCVF